MKLINTINGINYVTIEYYVSSEGGVYRIHDRLKRFSGILQSCHHYGGLFKKKYSILTVLIPENEIRSFNKEVLNEI